MAKDLTAREFFNSIDNALDLNPFDFAEMYAEYKMRITNDMLPTSYQIHEEE